VSDTFEAGGGTRTPGLSFTRAPLCQLSYPGAGHMVRGRRVVCFGHGLSEASGIVESVQHPKDIGDRSTLAIMFALHTQGNAVLVPFGENTRYDLVVDNGSSLRRVQCKTGRLRNGAVLFATCSCYGHHGSTANPRRDYQGEVDDFAVFCPELGSVYLIPIEDIPVRNLGTLRVDPPANGQVKNVRFAATYEIARIDVF
jgi:hypothetical protein